MVKENGMVMLTDEEYNRLNNRIDRVEKEKDEHTLDYERRLELMQTALIKLTQKTDTVPSGVRVSKADFIAMHNAAVRDMDGNEDNDIYGYDFTVHWHGIYCNCSDGATPANHIVPAIEWIIEEDPTEYEE